MAFNYNAVISDTNDAIPGAINSAVNNALAPLTTRVSNLEAEKSALETRVAALEDGSTTEPTPTPDVNATVVGQTVLSLGAATTSKTIAKPANVQEGDLLLMIVAADWGLASAVNPSSGFTQITEHDLGSNFLKVNISYKVAGSSEPSSYNVGVTTNTDARVDLIAIRNAKTTGAIAFSSVGVIGSTSTTAAHSQQVVPSTSKGLLLISAAVSRSSIAQYDFSFTPPPGMTELSDANTNRWLAMTTAYTTYNNSTEVPSRGFGLSTTANTIDKVLVSLVVPSAGS